MLIRNEHKVLEMIITKKQSFGFTLCVYYCTNEQILEYFDNKVPLIYCGVDIESFHTKDEMIEELSKWESK